MTIYNWLSLLGFPALFLALETRFGKMFSRLKAKQEANDRGTQALLRDRLYQLYEFCRKKNGATEFQRENFENMYQQYHALGVNGVMDDVRTRFMALPIEEEGK